jgi:hypothetical protein
LYRLRKKYLEKLELKIESSKGRTQRTAVIVGTQVVAGKFVRTRVKKTLRMTGGEVPPAGRQSDEA